MTTHLLFVTINLKDFSFLNRSQPVIHFYLYIEHVISMKLNSNTLKISFCKYS